MAYIEKSLGMGEVIVAKAHFHWWYCFKAWLALIFLGIFLVGIWIFFSHDDPQMDDGDRRHLAPLRREDGIVHPHHQ